MSLYAKLLTFYICIQKERAKKEMDSYYHYAVYFYQIFFNFKENRASYKVKIILHA